MIKFLKKVAKLLGIKRKKPEIKIEYLKNLPDTADERSQCPFCSNARYVVKNEYEINSLIERWKNQYAFVPFSDCYKGKTLQRRICLNCGTNYYNYFLPDTEEFYEKLTSLHPIYSKNKWDYDEALEIVLKYKPKSLLDVGCGYGYFIEKIQNAVDAAAGSEFNQLAVDECNKKGIKVYTSDLSQIEEKFSMITAFQVLEHIKEPDNFVKKLLELLDKNGLLLFVTPNPKSELIKYNPGILELPPHHNLDISKETFEYIAKQHNLKILLYKCQEIMPYDYNIYLQSKYGLYLDNTALYDKYILEKNSLVGKSHLVLFEKM